MIKSIRKQLKEMSKKINFNNYDFLYFTFDKNSEIKITKKEFEAGTLNKHLNLKSGEYVVSSKILDLFLKNPKIYTDEDFLNFTTNSDNFYLDYEWTESFFENLIKVRSYR